MYWLIQLICIFMYIGCLEVRIRIVIRSCMISVVLDGIQVPGMYIHYMCLCPLLVNNWER